MSSRDTPFGLSFPRLRRGPLPLTGPRTATSLSLHHPPLRSLKAPAPWQLRPFSQHPRICQTHFLQGEKNLLFSFCRRKFADSKQCHSYKDKHCQRNNNVCDYSYTLKLGGFNVYMRISSVNVCALGTDRTYLYRRVRQDLKV